MALYTKDDILRQAGGKSYDRGIAYIDAIEELSADDKYVDAAVRGSELYEVRIHLRSRGLHGECDCPWGEEGNFCKHCVAVALVYLYEQEHGNKVDERFDVRAYLRSLDHETLVGLLAEAAEGDRTLRKALERRGREARGLR
ncbi:SWIM zinc finger family protein [Spirillospora albida]|uniref:SWIM zinc finger family protein n=1 Tax=Spirillospora albida TaxID=58123 RepID=UPI000690A760|nr:SWIM zinc finger family protein [Spirillospora albida]